MSALIVVDAVGVALTALWLAAVSEAYRSISSLKKPLLRSCRGPFTSVIVPVRLHSSALETLLPSLSMQECVEFEVILVDDRNPPGESERIHEMAERYGYRVVRIDQVPEGWAPKPYAIYRGYLESRGDVLVFLDADTRLESKHSLALMRDAALDSGGIAAFHPLLQCRRFRCKAATAALMGIAHSYGGFHRVMNGRGIPWFYGCCWSIERGLYERLGGHGAVANSIVEDRDFAAHARALGVNITVYRGVNIVSTQWHDDIEGIVGVLMRILAHTLTDNPLGVILRVAAVPLAALTPIALILAGTPFGIASYMLEIASSSIASLAAGINPIYALGYPFAVQLIPLSLARLMTSRRIVWRGWVYNV